MIIDLFSSNGHPCPICGSNGIPIIYIYADAKLMKMEREGKVMCGGCCIEKDNPGWHCKPCKQSWGTWKNYEQEKILRALSRESEEQ